MLRAVTYNVHGCIGRDGRHDPARTIQILREIDADIVALQEVDSRDDDGAWERFSDELEMHAVPGHTLTRGDGRYGNLLLTRHPVLLTEFHDLSVDGREPRRAIDCQTDIAGTRVRVIATHLGLKRWERRRQVSRLSDALRSKTDVPTLVMGDMNEWLLTGRAARRVSPDLHFPRPHRTFPAGRPLLALDQIWGAPAGIITSLKPVVTPDSRVASDHLPLVAEVDLKAAVEK